MKFLVVLILAIIIGSEGSDDPTQCRLFKITWNGIDCLYPKELGLIGLLGVIFIDVEGILLGGAPCMNTQPNVFWSEDPISTDPNVGFSFRLMDGNGVYMCTLPNSSVGHDSSCNEDNSIYHAIPTTDGLYTCTNNDNKRWKWGDDGSVNCEDSSSPLSDNNKFSFPQGSLNGTTVTLIHNGQNECVSLWEENLVLNG